MMDAVEQAEQQLLHTTCYAATNVDSRPSKFTFTLEEEQALEEKLDDAISAYRRTLEEAEERLIENKSDSVEMRELRQRVSQHQESLKNHVVTVRKLLVSYRQRAKNERVEHARTSLFTKAKDTAANKTDVGNSSTMDVTATLKRTRQVMSQEIERVSSVTKVLDDGRFSLRSSHEEYSSVNAEIAQVRKTLIALKWQARQDRMWIGAGMAILASTVFFIIYERTGLFFI